MLMNRCLQFLRQCNYFPLVLADNDLFRQTSDSLFDRHSTTTEGANRGAIIEIHSVP